MQKTRAAFDQSISLEDQVEIARIKAAISSSSIIVDPEIQKGLGREWNVSAAAKRTFLASLKLNLTDQETLSRLAEKYFDDMDVLLADIHEQKKAWDADVAAIRSKFIRKPHSRKVTTKSTPIKRSKSVRLFQKASFLLLDYPKASPSVVNHELAVFPNPTSSAQQQLSFEISQAGPVTIDILNLQGQIVRTAFNGTFDAGTQTLAVDLSNIPSTQFFYRIADRSGVTAIAASRL